MKSTIINGAFGSGVDILEESDINKELIQQGMRAVIENGRLRVNFSLSECDK